MDIKHHISKTWFFIRNRKRFKKFPFKCCIDSPLKLQGKEYIEIEEDVYIHKHGWIGCYKVPDLNDPILLIGKGTSIGHFCHISCTGYIEIGQNVLIADKVTIADGVHEYSNVELPIIKQPYGFLRKVVIGEGSWIADNCCIIGARIGKHCVIGAGSVVTKDIPDYSVAVGSPARVVKKYNFESKSWVGI